MIPTRSTILAAALCSGLVFPSIAVAGPVENPDTAVADPSDTAELPAPLPPPGDQVAYAGPPGTWVDPVEPPVAPAPVTGLAAYAATDAAAGRAFLTPTAITARKGEVRIDTWFPGMPIVGYGTVSYAVTNRVELGVGALWVGPLGEAMEPVGALSVRAKWSFLRKARGGLAVDYQHVFGPDEESLTLLSLVGSHCLDAACRTVGSLHVTAIPMEEQTYDSVSGEGSSTALHFVGGASLVSGRRTKVVVDLAAIEEDGERAIGLYGGLRWARRGWAADLGLVAGSDGDDGAILPLPLVGVSKRW